MTTPPYIRDKPESVHGLEVKVTTMEWARNKLRKDMAFLADLGLKGYLRTNPKKFIEKEATRVERWLSANWIQRPKRYCIRHHTTHRRYYVTLPTDIHAQLQNVVPLLKMQGVVMPSKPLVYWDTPKTYPGASPNFQICIRKRGKEALSLTNIYDCYPTRDQMKLDKIDIPDDYKDELK